MSLPSSALDVLRYAAACGDFHALHHDPNSDEARAAGGAVLPGRYQHGVIARLLSEALDAALTQLACSYLAPAYVGHELWLEARVRREPEGPLRVRLKLVDAAGCIVLAGSAQLTANEATIARQN